MAEVDILKRARVLIENQEEYYVCHAIAAVCGKYDEGGMFLQNWIYRLLNDYFTLESWLINDQGIAVFDTPEGERKARLLSLRLEWIDWMIKELESVQ